MITKRAESETDKKIIASAVARVRGAVHIAGVAVSETMVIKDEALDEINALKTRSGNKKGNQAVKKITSDTKNLRK